MSSHHIVKENQEPALIIANGLACSAELLGQLLEWSPFTLVLDGALNRVLHMGIHFDAVVGDFDSATKSDLDKAQNLGATLVHTPDQEKTDLQKSLDYLITKGHTTANIVWATGNRADHTFNNICTIGWYHQRINAVLLDDFSRIYVIPKIFKKKLNPEEAFSLIPLGKVSGITTRGLVYPLQDGWLSTAHNSGSSNKVAIEGMVEITYRDGILLGIESTDNDYN